MTPYPGDCCICDEPLAPARYGWLSIPVGWMHPYARVHTLCRSKFEALTYDQKLKLLQKQEREA